MHHRTSVLAHLPPCLLLLLSLPLRFSQKIIREIGGETQENPNDIVAQRKAEDLKFRKILEEQCHFKVIDMDKDGNCLFRCVAEVCFGTYMLCVHSRSPSLC